MTDAPAPVAEQRRIKSLDVMRGFAVLGILGVNAIYFSAPWQNGLNPTLEPLAVTPDTLWSWFVMHVFFEYKFITLFSLLFGASIFMVGGDGADPARNAILHRRLGWLLVFGLIHAILIWYGDILVTYALTAFVVMLMRGWSARSLIMAGAMVYAMTILTQAGFGLIYEYVPSEELSGIEEEIWTPPAESIEAQVAAYQGGLVSATAANAGTWVLYMIGSFIGLAIRTAGVMMIGMGLFKLGFLSGNARVWTYLLAFALGLGALALIAWQAQLNVAAGFDFMHMQQRGSLANSALSLLVSIGYASLLVLLVKAGLRFFTEPLAAVGRMAFTNYLTQSLIMTTIFWSGRGFGLYGEVDRPTLWALVLGVWVLQLVWSPLWLSRFRMGPFEWLWRRLSYGRSVEMTK